MKKESIVQSLLKLEYSLGTLIIFAQLFRITSIITPAFYSTFLMTLLLWGYSLMKKIEWYDILAIVIVFLSFSNVTINGLLNFAHFNFEYYKKFMMFSTTILFFSTASKLEISESTRKHIHYAFLLMSVLFIFMFFTQRRAMYLYHGIRSQYLIFRFTNPNMTGMFLDFMIMYKVLMVNGIKENWKKIVLLLLCVFEIYFVYLTKSRNALLLILIFGLLFLLQNRRAHKPIRKLYLGIVSVFPIVFMSLYLLVVDSQVFNSIFSFLVEQGKGLDSRVVIWQRSLNYFKESIFLGDYYRISEGTGWSQLHNTHLDIMTSYGVVVLLLVIVFLFVVMNQCNTFKNAYEHLSMIAFICTLILGIGEAAIFSGGLGIYLYAGIFLLNISKEKDHAH